MTSLSSLLLDTGFLSRARIVYEKISAESAELNNMKPLYLNAMDESVLEEKLKYVAYKVNDFLEVNPPLPKIRYAREKEETGYLDGVIELSYQDRSSFQAEAAIAHEYCHHIQDFKSGAVPRWKAYDANRALREGFARGVELIVARQIAAEKGNLRYSHTPADIAARELNAFISLSFDFDYFRGNEEINYPYQIGIPAFLVAEEMHGTGIYSRLLKSYGPYRLLLGLLSGKVTLDKKKGGKK